MTRQSDNEPTETDEQSPPEPDPEPGSLKAAMNQWSGSFNWYRRHARSGKKGYWYSEVALVLVTAAVPTSIALKAPSAVPALLGAVAAVLGGLRGIFQWKDNWIRDTEACIGLVNARTFFEFRIGRFATTDAEERLRLFVESIRDIEESEGRSWVALRRAESSGTGKATGPG